jgi:cyclic pyranopterin phosphate synthase
MRGTNDDEVCDFAKLTLNRRVTVRFIEYMPLGDAALRQPARHITEVSKDELGPAGDAARKTAAPIPSSPNPKSARQSNRSLVLSSPSTAPSKPASARQSRTHSSTGNPLGAIGFISAMSQPFCATCNRLRLTPTASCEAALFEGGEVDVRSILRTASGNRTMAIANAMTECVRLKPEVHSQHGNEQMSRIGDDAKAQATKKPTLLTWPNPKPDYRSSPILRPAIWSR